VLPPAVPTNPASSLPPPLPGHPDPKHNPTPANADARRFVSSPADNALDLIYRDYLHANDGSHLDGGIIDDRVWQTYYKQLMVYQPSHYQLPKNTIGTRFLNFLSSLLDGIVSRRHNSEKMLVFIMVILQRKPSIKSNKEANAYIASKLDQWEEGSIFTFS
jgi:hypothetical protein